MSKITLEISYECTLAHEGDDDKLMLLEAIDKLLCGVIKNDASAIIRIVGIEHIQPPRAIEYQKFTRPVNR